MLASSGARAGIDGSLGPIVAVAGLACLTLVVAAATVQTWLARREAREMTMPYGVELTAAWLIDAQTSTGWRMTPVRDVIDGHDDDVRDKRMPRPTVYMPATRVTNR